MLKIIIPTQLKRKGIKEKIIRILNYSNDFYVQLSVNRIGLSDFTLLEEIESLKLKNFSIIYRDYENGYSHVASIFNEVQNIGYLLYLADDDDIYSLYNLNYLYNFIKKSDIEFVYGSTAYRFDNKLRISSRNSERYEKEINTIELSMRWPEQCSVIYSVNALKEVFVHNTYSLDYFLMLELSCIKNPIFIDLPVGIRDINTSSISSNRDSKKYSEEFFIFLNILNKVNLSQNNKHKIFINYVMAQRTQFKKLFFYEYLVGKHTLNQTHINTKLKKTTLLAMKLLKNLHLFNFINKYRIIYNNTIL